MKKLFFTLLFAGVLLSTQAQTSFGGGLAYGSQIKSLGLGVNGTFNLAEEMEISPSFIYYFADSFSSYWELNGNLNYYFAEEDIVSIYGIAGLNFTGSRFEVLEDKTLSTTEIGLNIGVGSNFDIGESFTPFAEAKYVLGNADQLSLLFGVRLPLN